MQPRLSSSRKWTALPAEFLAQVRSVFEESFKKEIGKGSVAVQGKIYPEEILIRVSYKAPGTLKESGFDISVAYKQPKDNVLKLLHLAVDAGASLMEQLFTSDTDHEFPRLWEEVNFEKRVIFVQFSTENSELKAKADALLGEAEDEDADLAGGAWDEDDDLDPDELKAQLGLDDDDEDLDDGDEDEEGPPAKVPAKKPGKTKH